MQVKLKTITPNAEVNIVEIARVSSSRVDKTENPEGLLKYLIKNKHWSPFQHSYITFEIVTSKSIAIQLLRHLSFTFQEFSQRYAKVENIESVEFRLQAEKNRQSSSIIVGGVEQTEDGKFTTWQDVEFALIPHFSLDEDRINWITRVTKNFEDTLKLYNEGLDLGFAKECVRFILPQAAQTTLFMTGSIRSWIHMLQIRVDEHAQKEVRLIGQEIQKIFIKELPIISAALDWDKMQGEA